MALVDHQIAARVERDNLIDSYDKTSLINIGYDLRAKQFYVPGEKLDSVTLQPNESAFVESVEIVTMPTDLLGQITLRNSRIRQGLSLDAPVYQPGHKTRIYFRLTNVSADSITLYRGDKYATIIFEELSQVPDHPYDGAFKDEFRFRDLGDYKDLYKRQMQAIDKKVEDIKALESSIYTNVLTILSIFVALFSFLTTNITLAANSATVKQYFIFNALLLGCISFLVALLNSVVKTKKVSFVQWIPAVVSFAAAFVLYYT